MGRTFLWFLFQSASQGALPSPLAATSPEAKGGTYFGPDKMGGTRGFPTMAKVPPQALDLKVSSQLWEGSQRLAGVTIPAMVRNSTNLVNL